MLLPIRYITFFFAVVATAIFTLFLLVLSTAANLLFVSENF